MTLGVVLPLVLILGTFTAIEYTRHRAAILGQLSLLASHSQDVVEQQIVHELRNSDFSQVAALLDSLNRSEKFRLVYLLDPTGRVLLAPPGDARRTQLSNLQPDCQPCHRLPREERPTSVIVTTNARERVLRTMRPIENASPCTHCHDPTKRLLGLLLIDIPMAPLEQPVASALRENVLWWIGTIVVTVLVVNFAMNRLVIRRLQQIAQALTRFGKGQRDLQLPAESPDEIGSLAITVNELGQSIQSEEARNRALSTDLRHHSARAHELLRHLITAQEEERRRVARDLHDDLGQDLAALAVRLEAIERMVALNPEEARLQLSQVGEQIAEMTTRAYDMILALRPSVLDDLGLVPALRTHAERALKDTGIEFDIDARELKRRLPPEIETALFRTFQEALNNVIRHSGATRVRVSLAVHNRTFEGSVDDDGRAFDPETVQVTGDDPRGLGLLGMQERVAHCGGTLEINSRPGSGTSLRIRIPIPEASIG